MIKPRYFFSDRARPGGRGKPLPYGSAAVRLALFFVIAIGAVTAAAAPDPRPRDVTLLYTTDFHSAFPGSRSPFGAPVTM